MKIGIIGAGFTGLTTAYRLSKQGFEVTVFESSDQPGGLAIGFKDIGWQWTLEEHYHHLFTNDYHILNLAKEINHPILEKRPKTSTYYKNIIYQLDSPISLLKFSPLSLLDRLRTSLVLSYLKITPFWKPLEKITTERFLKTTMGENVWRVIWHPLMFKKFGEFSEDIAASWFWARIKKRTPSLCYPTGGFLTLAQSISEKIINQGGKIYYSTKIIEVKKHGSNIKIATENNNYIFDKVICTLPTNIFTNITKGLPKSYLNKFKSMPGLGAINLVLSLNKKFLEDGTYWLNISDLNYPFLAIVEHTNFIDKKYYGNSHLVYIGNYLPKTHKYFNLSSDELLNEYLDYLKMINPKFNKSWVKKVWSFKASFAQPIIPLNYSQHIPTLRTPIKGLYLANIQQVYPWDRGTNYAVELGERVAELLLKNKHF